VFPPDIPVKFGFGLVEAALLPNMGERIFLDTGRNAHPSSSSAGVHPGASEEEGFVRSVESFSAGKQIYFPT
jgi:hypothetical protein